MSTIKKQGRRLMPLILIAVIIGGIGVLMQVTSSRAAHCSTVAGSTRPCTEDVFNTKHNLNANTDIGPVTGTTEVCVFCHTPHGGRTDVAGGSAPLWNRALPPSPGDFQNYDSPNFDNLRGTLVGNGPRGVSLACLSCHDGVIAFDALINAPGSGGFQSANRATLTDNASHGQSLSNIGFGGLGVDGAESFKEGDRASSTTGGGFTGGRADFVNPTGSEGMEPFPNLGRNLTDDHPISMQMPFTDPQFADALGNLEIPTGSGNIRGVKRAGRQMPTDKRDWIRLYPTADAFTAFNPNTTTTEARFVECASCHNPHTPRTSFLRLPSTIAGAGDGSSADPGITGATRDLNHEPNQGSLICLTCHQK